MKLLISNILIILLGAILVSSRSVTENEGKRLIQTSQEEPAKWMTEKEIFQLIQKNKGFMDITDFDYSDVKIRNVPISAIPERLQYSAIVQDLITSFDDGRVERFLLHFSSYYNRAYTSATGRESQQWLLSQVQEVVQNYSGKSEVIEVDHGFAQRSIIARLEGADDTLKSEVVIVGGHLDSVTSSFSAPAPGADDNGSGSVVVLEVLRAIVEAGIILKRTVEFHWYAGEEAGLLGSQAIAQNYSRSDVNVVGMLNLDVVGYYVRGIDEVAIYTDYASPQLAQLARILTDGYLVFGRRNRTCGYGCSDHASWNRNGFPAVFVAEAIDSPYMHSTRDTIDIVNITQVREFEKLTLGFAIEMGEPVSQAP